ncbi:hypothetical protein [Candidatus Borreliella tachyglossi]|uniref:hypothetical protein n=1 Tax=Candidatus Borreliella tachyglossi TaxID=1964448 RepID=UPI0040411D0E
MLSIDKTQNLSLKGKLFKGLDYIDTDMSNHREFILGLYDHHIEYTIDTFFKLLKTYASEDDLEEAITLDFIYNHVCKSLDNLYRLGECFSTYVDILINMCNSEPMCEETLKARMKELLIEFLMEIRGKYIDDYLKEWGIYGGTSSGRNIYVASI